MMRAMILAAGFGSRLGELSATVPKPLLPMCDIPILRYGLALLAGHGYTEVAINTHHLGDLVERTIGDGSELGLHIRYSREDVILGTGGGVVKIADWLTDGGTAPCLVMNGKLVLDVDLTALEKAHRDSGALATLTLRRVDDPQNWGVIELDENDRVTKILGAGPRAGEPHMFTGVHVLSPEIIARLPQTGASDSVRDAYVPALREGGLIGGFRYDGYFAEHSTPARYLQGIVAVLRDEAQLRFLPGPTRGIDRDAVVHASAIIHGDVRIARGATIAANAQIGPDVVVGHDAHVAAGVTLQRTIVWPGARVTEDASDAIVTASGGRFDAR
jgi:mannose-1-phosphate guanylyltransferase